MENGKIGKKNLNEKCYDGAGDREGVRISDGNCKGFYLETLKKHSNTPLAIPVTTFFARRINDE